MKGKQSNRAVAKKIGGNKTVVEKKKSTQKNSTGLKITEKRGRQKEKRRNRGGVKKHHCGYTVLKQGDSRICGGNDLTDARDTLIIRRTF